MEELICVGCGIKLQCEDESKEGYVNPKALTRDFVLCKRCYQLKHYGKFTESTAVKNTINLLHESANKNDLVILIADVALTYTPLTKVLKELNGFNNVILVANRYDLYKDYIKVEKALAFLNREAKAANVNFKKIFIINDNIDEIFDYIDSNSIENNAYLVGLENAGKTSFVNKILAGIANENTNFLTNSKYPGTTVDLIKINLDDQHYLIDSPGIHSKGNVLNYVSTKYIKNLQSDTKIKPTIYQLSSNQTLCISNIVRFDYVGNEKQSIVFYGSSRLEITRCKTENATMTFDNRIKDLHLKSEEVDSISKLTKKTIKVDSKEKTDIVIEGFGFFTVKRGTYHIYTFKDANVFTRKAMI